MTNQILGTSRFKDGYDEILISIPFGLRTSYHYAYDPDDRPGRIMLQDGVTGYQASGSDKGDPDRFFKWKTISSVPGFEGDDTDPKCYRWLGYTASISIVGKESGDELGWASSAGDFNNDGSSDILCGAPGADRNGNVDAGILYILFGSLAFEQTDLSVGNPPRVEIHGEAGDRLGQIQSLVDDFNGDGIDDIAFGVPNHDSEGLSDSGLVGVILGGVTITGENIFQLSQVATSELSGVIITGETENQRFGYSVATAGDVNGDGLGDVIITAPGEVRVVNGQTRHGVVYLVYGSANPINKTFTSSQIGTAALPGKVFISPYAVGSLEEAAPEMAKGIGDVDGDGYDDLMIGNPKADFVYTDSEGHYQRRDDAGEAYLIYGNSL
jgi:hypothetical protein